MCKKILEPFHERTHQFSEVAVWIFDFDDTLYRKNSGISDQIDRRMREFVARELGIPEQQAAYVQKDLYHKYGTTMRGLMSEYGIRPEPFLDYTLDIDPTCIVANPLLDTALGSLPGGKYIFTNSVRKHVINVGERIGILDHFDGIFDIRDANYIPKPNAATYTMFLDRFRVHGRHAAIFDDLPCNLLIPSQLGMITVLVKMTQSRHEDQGNNDQVGGVQHTISDIATFLQERCLS